MIITNRPRNSGQGFNIVKNKRAKLPINFDLNSLNLMCTYVLTENRNIKRGQYINLRNLIELLDMEKYIIDQERYKRVMFIKKALEARLVKGLNDPVAIVKYTNGGLMDSDIIDIPLRNLIVLYRNGNVLGNTCVKKIVSFRELEAFSIIDGAITDDLEIIPALINKPSEDLYNVMRISSLYGEYGMQDKFNALSEITLINHRRLMRDNNEYKPR